MSPRLVAEDPSGNGAALRLDASGFLKVVLSGGGGGGGDASAANQTTQIQWQSDTYDALISVGSFVDAIQGVLVDTQAYTVAFSAKFPTASVPANGVAVPAVSVIQTITAGVDSNSGNLYKVDVDGNRRLSVLATPPGASTTSNSTSYQIQRTAAAFSCTVRAIEAFSKSAGYVVLVDKASAAANGDFPKGGSVFPITAGGRIDKDYFKGKTFTSGCVIALCTSVDPTITLAVSADAVFTVQLD